MTGPVSANVQDQDGGIVLVRLYSWIETNVVDGGYKTRLVEAVDAVADRVVEVVL